MGLLSGHYPDSDDAFADALRHLLDEGVSLRKLSAESRCDGGGISAPYLSRLLKGVDSPTISVIETVSRALGVEPTYFLEYRLAAARAMLDEYGPGGARAAAENLKRFERVFGETRVAPVKRHRKLAA